MIIANENREGISKFSLLILISFAQLKLSHLRVTVDEFLNCSINVVR